ncbi:hypothetical protein [Listeria ivanovii]
MPIANGEQPLTENSLLDLFVIVAIGVFFSIFIFKETFEKQYKKEKSEKDERYFRNRNTFSFYFIIISAILVPILLTVLSAKEKHKKTPRHQKSIWRWGVFPYFATTGI